MKKQILIIILVLALIVIPIRVNAFEIKHPNNFVQIIDNTNNNDVQEQKCDGDHSILGSVNDPNSVAWLLQQVFNYIKIIGPIFVVVLSSVDFAKVIIKSDDEAMAKAQKTLITRIILAACLFFIPTLVSATLDLFGITSDATCGLK